MASPDLLVIELYTSGGKQSVMEELDRVVTKILMYGHHGRDTTVNLQHLLMVTK